MVRVAKPSHRSQGAAFAMMRFRCFGDFVLTRRFCTGTGTGDFFGTAASAVYRERMTRAVHRVEPARNVFPSCACQSFPRAVLP